MVITGGTVEFSRTVKPADYESKGAKVVLSFGVDEGEDTQGVLERVSAIAMRHALGMVGLAVPAELGPDPGHYNKPAFQQAAEAIAAKPKRQSRKPVDPAAIEEVVETRPTDASSAELMKSEPSAEIPENAGIVDPAAIEDIEEVVEGCPRGFQAHSPAPPKSVAPVTSTDPAAIEDIEEVPVEAAVIVISDKDLATACANAREEKGAKHDVMAVRKLIGEYAAPGIRMSEIAKDKRQAFLDALKAL